jgi:hypothetical protein
LGISQGPIHAELRHNETGVYVVEIAPRSIGGYCSKALRFQGDISLEELVLRQALGENVDFIPREPSASGVMMIPTPIAGTLIGVAGLADARQVPGIDEVLITIPPGTELRLPPYGSEYLGFIFSSGAKPEDVEAALRTAHNRLHFEIEVKSSRDFD